MESTDEKTAEKPPATAVDTTRTRDGTAKKHVDMDEVVYKETILDSEQCDENAEIDRRLNRKFDLQILPWLFGIWYAFHI